MKKLIFLGAIFLGILSFKQANAQISFELNINKQPLWGPVGHDHVDYYYLPDIGAWYDVPHQQFIYQENKKWVKAASLPAKYKNFDLYKSYKVVVNQPNPYLDDRYGKSYAKYKGRKSDPVIRDSKDRRYNRPGSTPPPPPPHPNGGHGKPNDHH